MRIKQHQPTEGVDYLTDINNSKRLLARTISNEVVSDKGQDLLAVNYNLITKIWVIRNSATCERCIKQL